MLLCNIGFAPRTSNVGSACSDALSEHRGSGRPSENWIKHSGDYLANVRVAPDIPQATSPIVHPDLVSS